VGTPYASLAQEKQLKWNVNIMKKANNSELTDDLRPEYDLSKLKGVRGKYAQRFQAGTNLVRLAPDVARFFPDEKAVNSALKSLIGIAQAQLHHAH
jgi:hypothetical protein